MDCCGRSLSELDAAVQEFGRRNPLLAKQLSDAIGKLSEMHHHTTRLADCRNNWLKKVLNSDRICTGLSRKIHFALPLKH